MHIEQILKTCQNNINYTLSKTPVVAELALLLLLAELDT